MPDGEFGLRRVFSRFSPWGFTLSFLPLFLIVYTLAVGATWMIAKATPFTPLLGGELPSADESLQIYTIVVLAQTFVGIPLMVLWRGGIAHLSLQSEGSDDRISDALGRSAKSFWRLLALESCIWLLYWAAYTLFLVAMVIPLAIGGGSTGFARGFACLFYPLVLALIAVVSTGFYGMEAYAVREVVAADKGFFAAWQGAWHFFREHRRASLRASGLIVILATLAMILIALVLLIVQGIYAIRTGDGAVTARSVLDLHVEVWPAMLVAYIVVPFIGLSAYLWFENTWSDMYLAQGRK